MDLMSIVWMGLIVVFLIVEAACPLHLVSIWFAAGALASLITAQFTAVLWIQISVFAVVSGGLLLLLWPFTRRYLNPGHKPTNLDAIVGSQCYVTSHIDNVHSTGQVKLNGMEWTARSTSGDPIPVGELVKVDRIEGVKVFVSPAVVNVS